MRTQEDNRSIYYLRKLRIRFCFVCIRVQIIGKPLSVSVLIIYYLFNLLSLLLSIA